jgi:hypothetical protein
MTPLTEEAVADRWWSGGGDATSARLPRHRPKHDRDVPLIICDRTFNADGSLWYPSIDPSLHGEPGVNGQHTAGVHVREPGEYDVGWTAGSVA